MKPMGREQFKKAHYGITLKAETAGLASGGGQALLGPVGGAVGGVVDRPDKPLEAGAGGLAGGAVGSTLGGALGSAVAPGIGTAIGGMAGGAIGAGMGSEMLAGKKPQAATADMDEPNSDPIELFLNKHSSTHEAFAEITEQKKKAIPAPEDPKAGGQLLMSGQCKK